MKFPEPSLSEKWILVVCLNGEWEWKMWMGLCRSRRVQWKRLWLSKSWSLSIKDFLMLLFTYSWPASQQKSIRVVRLLNGNIFAHYFNPKCIFTIIFNIWHVFIGITIVNFLRYIYRIIIMHINTCQVLRIVMRKHLRLKWWVIMLSVLDT